MTHPDLERELEGGWVCGKQTPPGPMPCECEGGTLCSLCHARPAVAAYVKRKLDEAYADNDSLVRGQAAQLSVIDSLTRKLDEARADSELLEKVEDQIGGSHWISMCDYSHSGDVTVSLHSDSGPTGTETIKTVTAHTLRDALRKLVGEES